MKESNVCEIQNVDFRPQSSLRRSGLETKQHI